MNKKVFISYSWDSEEHKLWVLNLADTLLDNGVIALVDQYDISDGESITQFMEKSITESDYTLVILTPNYKEKSIERKGGVGYEQQIISGEILSNNNKNRFIPILREGEFDGPKSTIPSHFKGIKAIDFRGENYITKTDQLLRTIHKKPKLLKPKLGKTPLFENITDTARTFSIDLTHDFKFKKSEIKVTNDLIEIADLRKQNVKFKIEFSVGNLNENLTEYNSLKSIAEPTDKQIERKLNLRNILSVYFFWQNGTLYEYLQSSLFLIIDYHFNKFKYISYPEDLFLAIKKCYEFYYEQQYKGTGFDVFNDNLKWGFKIFIDDLEVKKLLSVFGIKDKGLLTAIAGLDVYDLSQEALKEEVIPRMSKRFTRDTFMELIKSSEIEEFLKIDNFRIGLA